MGREFEQLNSKIKREIILGAGHNTHIENPRLFHDVVNAWLTNSI
ncbi:2-succinyl-6-hydroxy-2,4-cyclohexadiene-1-carboxylate synthase [Desulfallas thermosapovorans DSM 6562]|uniref:2-succinyl-6-hydroxy-2, 4-cyclohexadiene-1-carboxylate synthase n=1 Tax=Desulfallas thermosapovorans DSM 6562 TaxID=1121431 RepID=A0A5S4ZQP6_9FIRM|nr:2-succinyl-6-hydroxy-2,4-cyclohexadiene-1-carboxylate synthase [Desulfallas thermosapovorans DSM 6562]